MSGCCTVIFPGDDAESRRCRNLIARYLNLSAVLSWRNLSSAVFRRFPTMDKVVESGLMTKSEFELYNSIEVE